MVTSFNLSRCCTRHPRSHTLGWNTAKKITVSHPALGSNEPTTSEWVEGIGDLSTNFLTSIYDYCATDQIIMPFCIYDNAVLVYQSPSSVWYDACFLVTGVEEAFVEDGIRIHPNPTTGKVRLEVLADGLIAEQVVIFNSIGQEVIHLQNQEWSAEIDLSLLPGRLFFVTVLFDNGQFSRSKLIKVN